MDSHPDFGGKNLGPSPLEVFIASGAACSAIDVIEILEKKRQKVTKYTIEVDGDRVPPGTFPRPYTKLKFVHIVEGDAIDEAAVEQAVRLSDEKYCSVIATLRATPEIVSEYKVISH
jgi:putative redox protein